MVTHKDIVKKYVWGQDCISWVLNNSPALSIKQELMPAGTKEQLHLHLHSNQYFFMLKGNATFFYDGQLVVVKESQGLLVENNKKHFIMNESDGIIEFLVISQPSTNQDRIDL